MYLLDQSKSDTMMQRSQALSSLVASCTSRWCSSSLLVALRACDKPKASGPPRSFDAYQSQAAFPLKPCFFQGRQSTSDVFVRTGRSYDISYRFMSSSYLLGWGNKPWERLAKQLMDEGYESKYLDRLQQKVNTVEAQMDELEKEILQETACALRKTEDKVNYALLRLECAGRDINQAGTSEERIKHIKSFNKIRLEALDARRDLTIHREAVGMRIRNWDRMLTLYPIPSVCRMDATFAPVVKQESPTTLQQLDVLIKEARLAK